MSKSNKHANKQRGKAGGSALFNRSEQAMEAEVFKTHGIKAAVQGVDKTDPAPVTKHGFPADRYVKKPVSPEQVKATLSGEQLLWTPEGFRNRESALRAKQGVLESAIDRVRAEQAKVHAQQRTVDAENLLSRPLDDVNTMPVLDKNQARRLAARVPDELDFIYQAQPEQAQQFSLIERFHQFTYDPTITLVRPPEKHVRRNIERAVEKTMPLLRTRINQARRFYLDDDFVWEAVRRSNTATPEELVNYTEVCKPPFESVWIEYDNHRRVAAERAHGDDGYQETQKLYSRAGYLIVRHPTLDSCAIWHCRKNDNNDFVLPAMLMVLGQDADRHMPFGHHAQQLYTSDPVNDRSMRLLPWGTGTYRGNNAIEDGPLFSPLEGPAVDTLFGRGYQIEEPYFWRACLNAIPRMRESVAEVVANHIADNVGELAFIATVLAMINVVPVKHVYAPAVHQHYQYRGKSLPFFDQSVVTIEAGKEKIIKVVDHAFRSEEKTRKRAHEVRGHWRFYHRGEPNEYKTWIKDHQRGDASLGFVKQTWKVEAHG